MPAPACHDRDIEQAPPLDANAILLIFLGKTEKAEPSVCHFAMKCCDQHDDGNSGQKAENDQWKHWDIHNFLLMLPVSKPEQMNPHDLVPRQADDLEKPETSRDAHT